MSTPNSESQLDYLHRQIAERLATFSSSTKWYRTIYFRSQMATLVLSAAITVLSGLKSFDFSVKNSSDVILVLGALVTVIAAWGAFFSPRQSWHLNAGTYSKLRALRAKLEFAERSGEAVSVDSAFAEYQQILSDHNRDWLQLRAATK